MMSHLCSLLIWLIMIDVAAASGLDPYFQKIGIEQGLSHRKVNCILQDQRGFMWFGTEDGLNRYDGRHFTHYRHIPNNAETISGNIISDLYEDQQGILWIATKDGGISRYDYRLAPEKQFRQFRHDANDPGSIPENGISKIVEDKQGYLWLGTSGSFAVRLNKSTGRFDTPVRRGTRSILSIANGPADTLWIGRAGGGLLKINTRDLSYKSDPRYDDLYHAMPHVSITAIFRDSKSQFWLGCWDKVVYRLDALTNQEHALNPNEGLPGGSHDDVVDFAEDKSGLIWMATKHSGVAVYAPDRENFKHFTHEPQVDGSLADDHVNDIYIDRNQVVWIATSNGISMFNPLFSPFRQYKLPPQSSDIQVYDFYKDADDRLWIGTSEGIFIHSTNSNAFEHRPLTYKGQKLSVTKFYSDVDQKFYIGTDYTLFEYDRLTNKINPLPNTEADPVMKKLINSRVVSVLRDTLAGHPVLLVSPYGHYLTYYDLIEEKWVSRADTVKKILKKFNLKDNLIRKFYRDNKNQLWLATYKAGLGQWQIGKQPVEYFANDPRNKQSLTSNDVFDIREDISGNLWISTYGGGVNYFDRANHKFSHLGASSNLTEGMQLDTRGNLWMLCNGHVHKYDTSGGIYTCYDLPRLQNTGGLTGYIYKDNGGTLYAAGTNYFITFNPAEIARINHAPTIYFTDFQILGKSYSHYLLQKAIRLTYKQNIFSIQFAAPEYTGDNLQYAYMIEGVDADWVMAGKQNVAQYTNLKGGRYRFKVRATNWKGSFGKEFAELIIIVEPPFWLTIWFWCLILLLLLGITYAIYRYRVQTLLKQHAIRNGLAQDLHDQVGSTLSSISVYSEVARRYAEQREINSLNDVLHTINHTANDMVLEMADIVWAINPKNDHLESILGRIRRFAQPLCDASGIKFHFDYDAKLAALNIGMKSRKNVFLILKESINNAVKHARCQNLFVHLILQNQLAELVITDDGCGFQMQTAGENDTGGNGLKNIRSRARELNASLDIRSEPGVGTTLKIIFRIDT